MEAFLLIQCNVMQRKNLINLTRYDETKKELTTHRQSEL